jgi:hypothetical protein
MAKKIKPNKPDPNKLAHEIWLGKTTPELLPEAVYEYNAKKLTKAIEKGMKIKFDDISYNDIDSRLAFQLRENAYVFSAAKTFQQTLEMSKALIDEDGSVRPLKEFKEKVRGIYAEYNENYLDTEYETAISSASSAEDWDRFEEEKGTLTILTFNAVDDEVEWELCGEMNDISRPVDDPIWDTMTPPLHFRCRCILEQSDNEEIITDPGEAKETHEDLIGKMDGAFKNNPGKSGELFSKDHPYFNVPEKYQELAKENFRLPIPK